MSTIVIAGSLLELPTAGIASTFDIRLGLDAQAERLTIELASDAPVDVTLPTGGINFISAEITDGDGHTVNMLTTTADDTEQVVPIDPFALIVSRSKRITALSLVRAAGQSATVVLIIGRK